MPDDFPTPKRLRGSGGGGHFRWRKQEKAVAKSTGGRVTPGSGNQTVKGDVRVKGAARIECKSTQAASFSVTRKMVEKITTASLTSGDTLPVIQVDFVDAQGNELDSVCVVPRYALEMLLGTIQNERTP